VCVCVCVCVLRPSFRPPFLGAKQQSSVCGVGALSREEGMSGDG
jgi:hypothetical protein